MAEKHAYLIAAHDNPKQLKQLISLLDDERNDIYVHVDRDSKHFPMNILDNITQYSTLIVLPRISVRWAHYSQTELQFRMLEAACQHNTIGGGVQLLSFFEWDGHAFKNSN